MKIETLKDLIAHITEPRRTNFGNIRHKLEDIIIIGLCTVICGGDDFIEMEDFGRTREEWLKQFLELPNGIPDSDTFRRVFERLNPKELSQCLANWLDVEHRKRSVVAVDGKTICGSANAEHKAFHVVSAFVTDNQITLGEINNRTGKDKRNNGYTRAARPCGYKRPDSYDRRGRLSEENSGKDSHEESRLCIGA